MNIKITFKDPDGVFNAVTDAAAEQIAAASQDLDEEETELLEERRREKINEALSRWIEHGEYLTVEFNTDTGIATVIEH